MVCSNVMPELKARIPTTETTRNELRVLVAKSDTAASYDDPLQAFIAKHAESTHGSDS